jgi:hypothetical protein
VILVVKEGLSNETNIISAGSQHLLGWVIVGSVHNIANEIHLPSCNHVAHARYVIKHTSHVLITYLLFFHSCHQNLQDAPNIAVKKDFQLVQLGFSHQPSLTPPHE